MRVGRGCVDRRCNNFRLHKTWLKFFFHYLWVDGGVALLGEERLLVEELGDG